MIKHQEILAKNYESAANLSQRYLYVSYITAVSLAILLRDQPAAEVVSVPFIDLQASLPAASLALIGIYFASGLACLAAVIQCYRIRAIACRLQFLEAIDTHPSAIHSAWPLRDVLILAPGLILWAVLAYGEPFSVNDACFFGGLSMGHIGAALCLCSPKWQAQHFSVVRDDIYDLDDEA